MNPKQQKMYWSHWRAVQRRLQDAQWPTTRIESLRHELHVMHFGYPKSSSALTNKELDRILMEFNRISHHLDLEGLWDLQDQPSIRARHVAECLAKQVADIGSEAHLQAYLLGCAKRIAKTEGLDLSGAGEIVKVPVTTLDDVTAEDWSKIIAALNYQLQRLEARKRPPPPSEDGNSDPF